MSILGLDVGTTGTKAVAFDLEGKQIASAYREYPLLSPRPGWQELEPNAVWQAVEQVLSEVAVKTASDPIRSLAISAQGEACHAVDASGECITNSVVTFDARTAELPAWWLERMSRMDIAQITGMPLHGMYSLNKILWFKQNQPEVYKRAKNWFCYEDFVHFKLGLEPVMSHSLAGRTMALDAKRGDWSDKMLDTAGVDRALLPRTAQSGEVVGTIPDSVAARLGLSKGVVVATGGHDQPAGALGAGIHQSGEAVYATGTVECICPIFDAYTVTDETVSSNLCCYPSCTPGLYASIAFNFTGGSLLKWYRDTFAGEEKRLAETQGRDVYDIICGNLPPEPESLLVLPHFTVTGTPHFDTASRGAILGLTLNTPREAIVSAILSGVTYEMKLNLSLLKKAGVDIQLLKAIGGGAKSDVWVQRKADIMGIPIAVLETTEAAALGVALLGGKAAGLADDLRQTTEAAVRVLRVVEPEPKRQAAYAARFELYTRVYDALKDISHGLAALDAGGTN
ncbi:MAG: hypothetical protein KJ052_07790 [Candidatus Hydrogenedentes bacterium]|nr:hypothetical protein [Candidatus Hydrogenedentota bacterium]